MTWKQLFLLSFLGLVVAAMVAAFQPSPGYMDADYYYASGLQLENGHGFTEPYLWNFLDDPAGLPHPSHAYWMPLASLIAAAGMELFGTVSWFAARSGFLLIAALIPPLTANLAWHLTYRRDLAFISGLLAVFPAFYLPFLPVTDTFSPYILLGGLFFLLLNHKTSYMNSILLGILAGLMHLTRADGLFWLIMAFTATLLFSSKTREGRIHFSFSHLLLTLIGYLLIMTPWFLRNISVFGTPLAPGGSKLLWLTSYDQLFSYPASQLTFSAWLHSGLAAILKVRLWALGLNLSNMVSVQGEVFLLPLILLGGWHLRHDRRIQLVVLAWLMTLFSMTVVFPFAGARGGYFHSGAALQTVWWVLAPVGMDRIISWGNGKRGWNILQAGAFFRSAMVVFAFLLTAMIVYGRVIGGLGGSVWGKENFAYSYISEIMISKGMEKEDVVMVANPPGFYLASGNPAIAVPDGDIVTLMAVAHRYGANYLILEAGAIPGDLFPVYENPSKQVFLKYLDELGGIQIYAIQP